ncbi:MAG: outer membrane lipoprotein carrier protein LolA, partial [Winogradskyella sp.]|nr:outer membrane lipoprotein carrier protein LolA [Winogradskyella sp.]
MKIKHNIIALLILFVSNGFAQSNTDVQKLLDDVSKKVKAYDNISIDFKYELNNLS